MTEKIVKKLNDSTAMRWTALCMVAFVMLCGYVLADVMDPLKPLLEKELLWTSSEYGIFTSAYGWFNVFLLMLIFGGMILDRMGVRFTGMASSIVMVVGCAIKYAAIAGYIGNMTDTILGIHSMVFYASIGFAIFGVGVETAGITVSKIIVKWFKGKEMALAMGMEMATARIGTMLAMLITVPIANAFHSVAAPILLCLILLCIGFISMFIYTFMDRKLDSQLASEEEAEEPFKVSDIIPIIKNKGFWLIAILCVLFYSAVFPFLKYAADLMVQKYHVSTTWARFHTKLAASGHFVPHTALRLRLRPHRKGRQHHDPGLAHAHWRALGIRVAVPRQLGDRRCAHRHPGHSLLTCAQRHVAFGA